MTQLALIVGGRTHSKNGLHGVSCRREH